MPNEKDEGRFASFYNRSWAIDVSFLDEIMAILENPQCQEPNFDYQMGKNERNGEAAIVQIFGILDQRMSWLLWLFGGTSADEAGKEIKAALDDPEVERIVLDIDSPGGSVDGIQSLSSIIYHGKQTKPIIAYVNSNAMSAAYWIASAATEVVLSSGTARVGSIGVVAVHRDISGYQEKMGVKSTEVTAGKFKRIVSAFEPLSDEGYAFLHSQVTYTYDRFVEDVARNRRVTPKVVKDEMAEGRIFIGEQAVAAGLADRIATMETMSKEKQFMGIEENAAEAKAPVEEKQETIAITVDSVRERYPDVYKAIYGAGARQERERILAIDQLAKNAPSGSESLIAAAKEDPGKNAKDLAYELMTSFKLERPAEKTSSVSDLEKESPKAVESTEQNRQDAEDQLVIEAMASGISKRR